MWMNLIMTELYWPLSAAKLTRKPICALYFNCYCSIIWTEIMKLRWLQLEVEFRVACTNTERLFCYCSITWIEIVNHSCLQLEFEFRAPSLQIWCVFCLCHLFYYMLLVFVAIAVLSIVQNCVRWKRVWACTSSNFWNEPSLTRSSEGTDLHATAWNVKEPHWLNHLVPVSC